MNDAKSTRNDKWVLEVRWLGGSKFQNATSGGYAAIIMMSRTVSSIIRIYWNGLVVLAKVFSATS
jgi:hypothetical protein